MSPEEQAILETPHVTVGYMRDEGVTLEVWSVSADQIWAVTMYGSKEKPDAVVLHRYAIKTARAMIEMLELAIEVCES